MSKNQAKYLLSDELDELDDLQQENVKSNKKMELALNVEEMSSLTSPTTNWFKQGHLTPNRDSVSSQKPLLSPSIVNGIDGFGGIEPFTKKEVLIKENDSDGEKLVVHASLRNMVDKEMNMEERDRNRGKSWLSNGTNRVRTSFLVANNIPSSTAESIQESIPEPIPELHVPKLSARLRFAQDIPKSSRSANSSSSRRDMDYLSVPRPLKRIYSMNKVEEANDMPEIPIPPVPAEDSWFQSLFHLQGSVLDVIYMRVALVGCITGIMLLVEFVGKVTLPEIDAQAHIMLGLALGLLLVFRTDGAYLRFWDSRKAWGVMVVSGRNLGRFLAFTKHHTSITGDHVGDLYAAAIQSHICYLRGEDDEELLKKIIKPDTVDLAMRFHNRPNLFFRLIEMYLDFLVEEITISQCFTMTKLLTDVSGAMCDCERVLDTPLPLPYRVQIRQMLFIYLMTLPIVLHTKFGAWVVIPAVMLLTFGLYGIEEAGHLIENPFGHDFCDLPLDRYFTVIRSELAGIFVFNKAVHKIQKNEELKKANDNLKHRASKVD